MRERPRAMLLSQTRCAGTDRVRLVHPLPAVVFSWVLAAVAAGCVGWLAISIRTFTRSLRTISIPLLVIQVVLLSLLWAMSGVIFSGDIAQSRDSSTTWMTS